MRDALTAGLPSVEQYADTRYSEALSALSCCGISSPQVSSLQIPDQAAARNLVAISRSIATRLAQSGADIVLTHPYEGGHPDHDAAAFCVYAASQLISRNNLSRPAIIEFTSYHSQADGIATGQFLPSASTIATFRLSSNEQKLKREMFARYATQAQVLAQFSMLTESFRLAPCYDFRLLPEAPIYYDRFDWGLRPAEWIVSVASAMHQLNL
jgi:LmbE family N-acetylglucosaminyl deacetylase